MIFCYISWTKMVKALTVLHFVRTSSTAMQIKQATKSLTTKMHPLLTTLNQCLPDKNGYIFIAQCMNELHFQPQYWQKDKSPTVFSLYLYATRRTGYSLGRNVVCYVVWQMWLCTLVQQTPFILAPSLSSRLVLIHDSLLTTMHNDLFISFVLN
jgi:hypothetical protein